MTKQQTFTYDDLERRYQEMTARVVAQIVLKTPLVGGQPASENGVRMFVLNHLGLEGEEAESAVTRILKEEIGEHSVDYEGGELKESLTYGISVIRRDAIGPWLGSWMPKACLKVAATSIRVFSDKLGSKRDVAELGRIEAHGISRLCPEHSERIYLIGPDDRPARTYFERFSGRVATPKGSKSIQHDSEVAPEGTRAEFEFRFGADRLTEDDVIDMFSCAMTIGLGSVKAEDRGKFKITKLDYFAPDRKMRREKAVRVVEQ